MTVKQETECLFGEIIIPSEKETTKKIRKQIKNKQEKEISAEKAVKSKTVSNEEKVALITENVNKVLGKQIHNVIVIKTRQELTDYISSAIKEGIIAVDTETNNSLDPITCKLMGLCLYTPNNKQAYVPINHVDTVTQEKLDWQLTEEDCREELQRIVDTKTFVLMHNAKFDFEVLKCTCNVEIMADWDTMIAAKLIDENEEAGLKKQYIMHVDPDQEKYSIEVLFEKMPYAIFPPDVFALYAATDSYMTYKLYEYQKPIMLSKDFEKIYNNIFLKVEMPVIRVVADMELNGVELDIEYSKRLSDKYHKELDDITAAIDEELKKYEEVIAEWKLTPEANFKPKTKNKKGEEVLGKSKVEQLDDPISTTSPTQLAILLYDILKVPVIDEKSPRGTGEDFLQKMNLPICDLLLKKRGIDKLLSGYVDVLPELAKESVDGRVRTHFNQYGAATGRFSSSNPINLQNIPSHNKEIRMLFCADTHVVRDTPVEDDSFTTSIFNEVLTDSGFISVSNIKIGDILIIDDNDENNTVKVKVTDLINKDNLITVYFKEDN